MATSTIEQRPFFNYLPVGIEQIFTISNQQAVANQQQVKFIADIHIGTQIPDPNTTTYLVGTFKTTPNGAGVGMFNVRDVIENYVKADNLAAANSRYKGALTTAKVTHPVHLIDKFSLNDNTVRYMVIRFSVEYLGATDSSGNQDDNIVRRADGTEVDSLNFRIFNAYVKYNDFLYRGVTAGNAGNFGFRTVIFTAGHITRRWLTNAPMTQHCGLSDYGTVAVKGTFDEVIYEYFKIDGSTAGTSDIVLKKGNTGSFPPSQSISSTSENEINYLGCFPGNLQNWSTNFATAMAAGLAYYTVTARNELDPAVPTYTTALQVLTIRLNHNPVVGTFPLIGGTSAASGCPDCTDCTSEGEGGSYDSIASNNVRICWLNQWGAWDYFTFTQKAVKTVTTQSSTYTQMNGTWNDSIYQIDAFKGGKRKFRVNAVEKVSLNTAFLTEDYNVVFEELMNSPEVYLLRGYESATALADALVKYVVPVRVTSSNFTRKTIANDRLIQYTIEVEKTKTLRTQTI